MILYHELLDLVTTVFQSICFPIYGIPKVARGDYIVIDRHHLRYLNGIEKMNCVYCGYVNGLITYVQEIASRTEQYWCPIKHAQKILNPHRRYARFADFGDSEDFSQRRAELRNDLAKES